MYDYIARATSSNPDIKVPTGKVVTRSASDDANAKFFINKNAGLIREARIAAKNAAKAGQNPHEAVAAIAAKKPVMAPARITLH